MGPDIALAASAREWPDRLHRFLLDHGGGRIVDRVMVPEQAVEGSFDVLLIDDVCSFLTPLLVTRIKGAGREVIGVFESDDGSDAKRRLLECGISDVIETEATAEEFLHKIRQTRSHRTTTSEEPTRSSSVSVAVTGACEGVGMTEVSIALALAIAEEVPVTLVDLDREWPSIAQRLDLPVHPNVRTAIDRAIHNPDRIDNALQRFADLTVVGGRADGGRGSPISRHDTTALLECLGTRSDVAVVDAGPLGSVEGGLLREFDTVIVVGATGPVGVARLIKTAEALQSSNPGQSHLAVVNQTLKGGFQRSEALAEVGVAVPAVSVSALPFDRKIANASWDGRIDMGNAFRKAIGTIAEVIVRSVA